MSNIVSKSTMLRSEQLPPTEGAAKFHLYCVHLQIAQWHVLSLTVKKPDDWGWQLGSGFYILITTDIAVAPHDLLRSHQV